MRAVAASAPGKLVLLGEYAVLFGHPAAVLAVNRRARVDIRPTNDLDWSVTAPGFQDEPAGFRVGGEHGFRWREPATEAADRLVLVEKVVGSLVASKLVDPGALPAASIRLDTREFFREAQSASAKLGLGSSAALTVALTEALRRWSLDGERRPDIDLAQLLDLHRSFQGGRGSGIDLAASFRGGVVEYRLEDDGRVPVARPLALPPGLRLVFLWTGRSASTSNFLARLDEEMRDDGGEIASALTELGRISTSGIADLRTGDVAALLGNVSAFSDAMDRLGHAAGISILSDEHLELQRLAREIGVSYKPSGAGGGDVGIAFTDDPARATIFASKADAAGYPPLDLKIDPKGVQTNFQF